MLHLPVFLLNTIALMFWLDQIRGTGVMALWFITLPFALLMAAIPYGVLVVLPCRLLSNSGALIGSACISGVLLVLLLIKADPSMNTLIGQVGFALQAAFVPCLLFTQLKGAIGTSPRS